MGLDGYVDQQDTAQNAGLGKGVLLSLPTSSRIHLVHITSYGDGLLGHPEHRVITIVGPPGLRELIRTCLKSYYYVGSPRVSYVVHELHVRKIPKEEQRRTKKEFNAVRHYRERRGRDLYPTEEGIFNIPRIEEDHTMTIRAFPVKHTVPAFG